MLPLLSWVCPANSTTHTVLCLNMYVLFIYDVFFQQFLHENHSVFWQSYLFGQTKIQNFVLFGHSLGTL